MCKPNSANSYVMVTEQNDKVGVHQGQLPSKGLTGVWVLINTGKITLVLVSFISRRIPGKLFSLL